MQPDLDEGLFPETLVEPFIVSEEVAELAEDVLARFDEFRSIREAIANDGLRIRYVFETKAFDPLKEELKPHTIAKVQKAGPVWRTLAETELVISFRQWFWEKFDEPARRRTLHHEFSHVQVEEPGPDGRPKVSLREHEIEDFGLTVRRFGPRPWHASFFKSYLDWQHEQDQPEPTRLRTLGEAIVERFVDDVASRAEGADGLRKLAEETGTDITVSGGGRSATIKGRPEPDDDPAANA